MTVDHLILHQGEDPSKQVYDQSVVQNHVMKCIQKGQLTLFPSSTKKRKNPSRKSRKKNVQFTVFADSLLRMIECAACLC